MERSSPSSSCKNCRKWEKCTYWNRFRTVQFFAYLLEAPHLQLRFPKKFVKNFKEELSENLVLYGPSGHTWKVGLKRSGGGLFLKNGWQEFVNAHDLKENDVLIFRYHGESKFEVLMFDKSNYCEKESSYFVKKCTTHGCKSNGKRTEERVETSKPSKKKRSEEDVNEMTRSPATGGGGANSATAPARVPARRGRPRKTKLDKANVTDDENIYDDLNPSYPLHFVSKRRSVTEAEESRAQEMADRAGKVCKLPHFVALMQPTTVSHRFHLTIPKEFVKDHFPRKHADTILSVEGREWNIKFTYDNRGGSGFNGSDWSAFVLDNNLEVGDVCLFELSAQKQNKIVLKVSIFRVAEEVVPLQMVTYSMSKKKWNFV